MVLVKKWPFFHLFFLGNIGQENVFYNILERKNAFLAYKKNKFKKSQNWDFSKGVSPWFWSNLAIFLSLFLGNIGQENVFCDILERENAFLGYKKKKFKKSKSWDFFKGVNPWFWSKRGYAFFKKWKKLNFCKGLDRLIISKNKQWKNFKFLNKSVDQPFWKNFNFFTVLKKHFNSPESLSSHLEYQQKIFPCFFFSKKQRMKKIRIFKQTRGLTFWKNLGFHFFKKAFV